MPYYQFDVCFKLTEDERKQLVDRVIAIHTRKFHTATFIVNVGFQTHGHDDKLKIYSGGKPAIGNLVHGWVRPGDGRTATAFNAVTLDLVQAWADIINGGKTEGVAPERELAGCFIEASINSAWEHGFLICEGGQDAVWLRANRKAFEALAKEENETFKYTLHEIDSREDLAI